LDNPIDTRWKKIIGSGEKIRINGEKLNYSERTTLILNGSILENNFKINYTEKGKLRETTGLLIGTIKDNKFEGTFSQTASDSKGNIIGIRVF